MITSSIWTAACGLLWLSHGLRYRWKMTAVLITVNCSPSIRPMECLENCSHFLQGSLMSQITLLKKPVESTNLHFHSSWKSTKQTALDTYYIIKKLQTYKPPWVPMLWHFTYKYSYNITINGKWWTNLCLYKSCSFSIICYNHWWRYDMMWFDDENWSVNVECLLYGRDCCWKILLYFPKKFTFGFSGFCCNVRSVLFWDFTHCRIPKVQIWVHISSIHQSLVSHPSCVPEKVGVNKKKCKSKMIFLQKKKT